MKISTHAIALILGVLPALSAQGATAGTIKPVNSGLCMDVSGASTANGAAIIQWNCEGSTNQLFTFSAKSNGQYQIVAKNSGKCVTVVSTASGLVLQQSTCGTGAAQLFMVSTVRDGVLKIVSVLNGACMDVPGLSKAPGVQIGAYACNGQNNQQFTANLGQVVTPTPTATPAPTPTPTPTPANPTPTPTPVGGFPSEAAKMADAFVDTIGINTHFHDAGIYQNSFTQIVMPAIQKSGIRHLRDGLMPNSGTGNKNFTTLINTISNNTGVRIGLNLNTWIPNCSDQLYYANVSGVLPYIPLANIDSVEGVNEYNGGSGCPGSTWSSQVVNFQKTLFNNVKNNSQLSAIKVFGPPLADFWDDARLQSDSKAVGNLTAVMNVANVHVYSGDQKPSANIARGRNLTVAMNGAVGSMPWTATETGYETYSGVSEKTGGKYFSRMFFEFFNAGASRTFAYELMDEPDKSGGESKYGIVRGDGTYKPAFTAVANQIQVLKDPGASFAPGSLQYKLANAPGDLHHTLLQKRNGRFYLVLWREVDSYTAGKDIDVAASSVTVSFATAKLTVNQIDPLKSATPFSTNANVTSLTVPVGDQALILEIIP
jgi:hypothetical protein